MSITPAQKSRASGEMMDKQHKSELNNAGYTVGQVVQTKKSHPCGGCEWEILRMGMDFRIRCVTCGHMLMLPRVKFEKMVKASRQ